MLMRYWGNLKRKPTQPGSNDNFVVIIIIINIPGSNSNFIIIIIIFIQEVMTISSSSFSINHPPPSSSYT